MLQDQATVGYESSQKKKLTEQEIEGREIPQQSM
jgi:hypothetical protein